MRVEDAYRQKMAAQLKEWSAQIDLYEAKAENAAADKKVRRAEELDHLRAKQRTAHEQLRNLEQDNGEAWGQLKEATDKVWEDLKKGMANAQARFK